MNIKFGKAHALSRRTYFRNLHISIETDKGELRHWYDPHNDTKGSTKMKFPYGYIRRTKGVDGDHVDVYIGPNKRAKNVYIIHQMKAPNFNTYDEDKCMLGFLSANAAKSAYLAHYNDSRFFGSMTVMPYEEFEEKVLRSFDLKRPHKIASQRSDAMTPIQKAYAIGQQLARDEFNKFAQGLELPSGNAPAAGGPMQPPPQPITPPPGGAPGGPVTPPQVDSPMKMGAALGDPNFWAPPAPEGPPPAQTAEDAVQLLPAGTFQGAQIKITPDGQRNTTVKVTPDAVAQPDALANVFAAEPAAKVEISQPEQKAAPEAGGDLVPPEMASAAGKMAALRVVGLR